MAQKRNGSGNGWRGTWLWPGTQMIGLGAPMSTERERVVCGLDPNDLNAHWLAEHRRWSKEQRISPNQKNKQPMSPQAPTSSKSRSNPDGDGKDGSEFKQAA